MAHEIDCIADAIEAYQKQERIHSHEGRRGVINLAKCVRAMGYRDMQNFGALGQGACVGDLIEFLEDNSGVIEAIFFWICEQRGTDWQSSITNCLHGQDDEHDDFSGNDDLEDERDE